MYSQKNTKHNNTERNPRNTSREYRSRIQKWNQPLLKQHYLYSHVVFSSYRTVGLDPTMYEGRELRKDTLNRDSKNWKIREAHANQKYLQQSQHEGEARWWILTLALFLLNWTVSFKSLFFLKFVWMAWTVNVPSFLSSLASEESFASSKATFFFFTFNNLYSKSVICEWSSSTDLTNWCWKADGCSRNKAFRRP